MRRTTQKIVTVIVIRILTQTTIMIMTVMEMTAIRMMIQMIVILTMTVIVILIPRIMITMAMKANVTNLTTMPKRTIFGKTANLSIRTLNQIILQKKM